MENSDHLSETQRAALTELRRYCNVVMATSLDHIETVASRSGSAAIMETARSTRCLVKALAATANRLLLRDEEDGGLA